MPGSNGKQTNYERVYQTLKEWIIQGRIAPGERLKETKLAEDLDTSRTPVREALRRLEIDGIVVFHPLQGATVPAINEESLKQLYECRAVLEGLAAKGAALRITEKQLAILEECVILAEQYSVKGEHEKVVEKNTLFHDVILEACENPVLSQMMEQIRTQILRYRTYVSSFGLRDEFSEEHRFVFEAIRAKDADKAEQSMKQHILNDLQAMIDRSNKEV